MREHKFLEKQRTKNCLVMLPTAFFKGLILATITSAGLMSQVQEVVTVDYNIDTLVVVDDVMYDSWKSFLSPNVTDPVEIAQKINEYVSLLVHQANKRLETTRHHQDLIVRMNLVDVQLDQPVLEFVPSNILTRRIRADIALRVFQDWVVREGLADKYDHLMLLTGTPMQGVYQGSGQSSVKGRANIGTVCGRNGTSVSVIEDRGGFQSSHVVAHELAHSLGAVHDGDSGAERCKGEDKYLMSASSQQVADGQSDVTKQNPWYMSVCSAESIKRRISEVERSEDNCLNATSIPIAEFTSTSLTAAGQVYNAVDQCRMLYGSGTSLCLGASFSSLDGICTTMYCATSDLSCAQHYAAEGTTCGNKMWCQMGRCVYSEEAPESSACPYGDTALLRGDGSRCAEYIAEYPSACYNDEIREICCSSCAAIHTDSEVCPYGDKRIGCTQDVCNQVYRNGTYLAELCCGTCNYMEERECQDVSTIDGLTCDERVTMYGNQECYNGTVAFYCCRSCSEKRLDKPGCEYGNFLRGSYCQSQANSDYSGCTRRLTSLCCLTCDPDFQRNEDRNANTGVHLVVNFSLICMAFISLWLQLT